MTLKQNGPAARQQPIFACQDQLLALYDLLVDVIFCMKDLHGRYVTVNRAFVRRTGRQSKREVIGRRANEVFSPTLAARYEEQDERVFTTGRQLRDELELICLQDGSLSWHVTTKLPVTDGRGPSIVGLVSLSRDLKTPSHDDAIIGSLTRLIDHIRCDLSITHRKDELAEVAGCSIPQLDRRMRNAFGIPVTKFILRERVDRAAELLLSTERSIADVGNETGFYDQADFTRRFGQLTGHTPAQFRIEYRVAPSARR